MSLVGFVAVVLAISTSFIVFSAMFPMMFEGIFVLVEYGLNDELYTYIGTVEASLGIVFTVISLFIFFVFYLLFFSRFDEEQVRMFKVFGVLIAIASLLIGVFAAYSAFYHREVGTIDSIVPSVMSIVSMVLVAMTIPLFIIRKPSSGKVS
jgi:hypothetical protein